MCTIREDEVMAIEGETLRRMHNRNPRLRPLHMVSCLGDA
jgi:hypothetical protein